MQEPWFWRETSLAARATAASLAPAAFLYDAGQRLRAALSTPQPVGAPVICVGNATLGGVGKTPFALLLQSLLAAQGLKVFFQSRGHKGSLAGPVQVNPQHTAQEVGDEPLLLAAAAPTFVARNRAAGARAAAAAGADLIILDDGFQNPTVGKDLALLILDAGDPAGNGRVFPAGPLREPLARALSRADAVILAGAGQGPADIGDRPVFRVTSEIDPPIAAQKIVAFCGIARPQRFFEALAARGFTLAACAAYADHHEYGDADLAVLRRKAKKAGARLITTEKDFVRLAAAERADIATAPLRMRVDDPQGLVALALAKTGRTA